MLSPVLGFLADLDAHNSREWFEAHRDRYEAEYQAPLRALAAALAPAAASFSPHFASEKPQSALSRIHRDTRSSADKRPYKDWAGMHFRHSAGKEAPGLYLRASLQGCGVGLGVWMLEPAELQQVRQGVMGEAWPPLRQALEEGGFHFIGEGLKKVPRGYPAEHPMAEDLKRKTFAVGQALEPTLPLEALVEQVEERWRRGWPLVAFLCAQLGLPL
jgi:uncharacterized protein (TIGR02453 family)